VALPSDHGGSYDLAVRCVEAGYTSVMIDGPKIPFAETELKKVFMWAVKTFSRRPARSICEEISCPLSPPSSTSQPPRFAFIGVPPRFDRRIFFGAAFTAMTYRLFPRIEIN
jgi:hypothetical protein